MDRQRWLIRMIVGMLVVAAVLAMVVWIAPVPVYAGGCITTRFKICDCGCCGADKGVWHVKYIAIMCAVLGGKYALLDSNVVPAGEGDSSVCGERWAISGDSV